MKKLWKRIKIWRYKNQLEGLLHSVRHFEIPYDIAEDQIIYYQNKIKELEHEKTT